MGDWPTAHNTKDLKVGRALDKCPQIVARLAGIADRFYTAVDCMDTSFLTDGTLDQLPQPSRIGVVRVGGVDPDDPSATPSTPCSPFPSTRRVHRRTTRRQGPHHDRPRIHRPPGRIRPAQDPRQTAPG